MKLAITAFLALLALAGLSQARDRDKLPENYRDWLAWTPPIDRRPFLIRLLYSVGFAFEVGAEKARLKIDSKGAEAGTSTDKDSLTVRELLPTGGAVTVKFWTDF